MQFLKNYVGKIVLLKFSEEFLNQASSLIQLHRMTKLVYARLVEVDETGIWIENASWETQDAKTQQVNHHKAYVLVPWRVLISVAVFPERHFEGDIMPEENEARSIGFSAKY